MIPLDTLMLFVIAIVGDLLFVLLAASAARWIMGGTFAAIAGKLALDERQ